MERLWGVSIPLWFDCNLLTRVLDLSPAGSPSHYGSTATLMVSSGLEELEPSPSHYGSTATLDEIEPGYAGLLRLHPTMVRLQPGELREFGN